tara:strand:- start:247 stop:705 length:459 start_codon:yes stop_codon:yes gene_type:complete
LNYNLDKYYGYARKIAGDLGEDLVHHLVIEGDILNRLQTVQAKDRYMYVTLFNAYTNSSSSFYKKYIKPTKEIIEADTTPSSGYDIIPIHTILLSLENEGNNMEVKVFKECYLLGKSEYEFSKRSGIDYRVIVKMCNYIKNEIRERYVYELD